jgi:hypothetical protein
MQLRRPVVASTLFVFVSFAAPPAAAVTTSTVDQGVLTVTGDADPDAIVIGCRDGQVTVNDRDPDSGPAACEDITSIVVTAAEGDDTVNLRRVSSDSFTALGWSRLTAGTAAT